MSGATVAVILGRKGSKGILNKNTMNILGRPAYAYPLLAAKRSKYVERIFFSTDIEEIIDRAEDLEVEIIDRPGWLAGDEALFEDALKHAYFDIKKTLGSEPKYLVVLMANAVTIDHELIDEAIERLEKDPEADSAVTVSVFNMYSPVRARALDENGYLNPFVPFSAFENEEALSCDRGTGGDVYFADMSHTVCRSRAMEQLSEGLLPQRWMGRKILPVLNANGCDMDEPWQVRMSIDWLRDRGWVEGEGRDYLRAE